MKQRKIIKSELVKLLKEGKTCADISKRLNRNKSAICWWMTKFKLQKRFNIKAGAKKGHIPWNTGLTKKDKRVKQMAKNISIAHTGRKKSKQHIKNWIRNRIGHPVSAETKKRQRLARLNYISKCSNNGDPITPTIGKNEMLILKNIEKENNIVLEKQFPVDGYFIDGYDTRNNIAYEVDEKHHHTEKNKLRDKEREEYIKEKLNCQFIRLDERKEMEKFGQGYKQNK